MNAKLLSSGIAGLLLTGCAAVPTMPDAGHVPPESTFSTTALPELSKPGDGFYEGWPAKWFVPDMWSKQAMGHLPAHLQPGSEGPDGYVKAQTDRK